MLLRRAGNGADMAVDAVHKVFDLRQRLAGESTSDTPPFTSSAEVDHDLISLRHLADRCASSRTSCATTAKPRPCLTGTGRFPRRIQREKVGLEGDFVDDGDDLADLLRRLLDPAMASMALRTILPERPALWRVSSSTMRLAS